MKLSTKTHGVLDYLMGILLIAAPWLFHFAFGGIVQASFVISGTAMLLMSLLTNYEAGLLKVIPMKAHLTLDFLLGLLLAASPWLFRFSDYIYLPHLIFGILEMGAALMTQTVPFAARRHSHA